MIRAVLFDAVGTLLLPDPPVIGVYQAVGRSHGSTQSAERIAISFRQAMARQFGRRDGDAASKRSRECVDPGEDEFTRPETSNNIERRRWRQVVGDVFSDVGPDRMDAIFEQLWSHFARHDSWAVCPHVSKLWRELAARGMRLGIASNFDRRIFDVAAGIPELAACRDIFPSADIGFSKPDRRFFRAVELRLRLAPDEILLVGDDPLNDIAGAQAAGWRTLLVASPREQIVDEGIAACLSRATVV